MISMLYLLCLFGSGLGSHQSSSSKINFIVNVSSQDVGLNVPSLLPLDSATLNLGYTWYLRRVTEKFRSDSVSIALFYGT
jgi:hypothetical protein